MRILHIIQGLPATAGTTVFVVNLAKKQAERGNTVVVATFDAESYDLPVEVKRVVIGSPADIKFDPDVVHIHAVWSYCQYRALKLCYCKKYKYVVSVHGCLMPQVFARSPLKKWLFYHLFLRRYLQSAKVLHCTCDYEASVCRSLGLRPPCVVVPIGIDIPDLNNVETRDIKARETKTLLFIGRIAKEKGLDVLLRAWQKVGREDWNLVLAGPDWLGYSELLKEIIKTKKMRNVDFIGTVDGEKKAEQYLKADLFVLPSPIENFSIVVLEALSYGIPVIATTGTPWKELEECRCGWWIDQGVNSLAESIETAMSLSGQERKTMGERGRKLAIEKYRWGNVEQMMDTEVYGGA